MSHMRPKGLEQHQSIQLFLVPAVLFSSSFSSDLRIFLSIVTCDCCFFFRFHFPRFCPPTTTRWVVAISVTRFVYSFKGPLISYQPICMFHRPTSLE
ncbi:hypothetical protein BDV39DRAFT_142214 [Aspergillus sergii]|uniref:Uncharacterized protein n=1 Tax=Aspergillus sergii TaxID=1034303 RepID=A0A5N6WQM2_9EURO|nr:hypothetical protein BDV39DRAFT_142214 [Aspergillus sergii]